MPSGRDSTACACRPGELMLGANHAVLDEAAGCSGPYMSHTIYSDDHGETWRLGESVGVCTNECSLAAFSDGEVLINMRHMPYGGAENPHCRAQAWAADGARFSQAALMPALVDATCQGSLLTVTTPRGEEVLLEQHPLDGARKSDRAAQPRSGAHMDGRARDRRGAERLFGHDAPAGRPHRSHRRDGR